MYFTISSFSESFKAISLSLLFITALIFESAAQDLPDNDRIQTELDTTEAGELIMKQVFTVDATVDEVWGYFTQEDLYTSWAAPEAQIDLQINGTIRATYDPEQTLGDDGTIVTKILNYIPKKLITLQAEVPESFSYFMKQYQDDLFNIIEFESTEDQQTTITSYGLGYQNTERFRKMMYFFAEGNLDSYTKLIDQIEGEN